MSEACRLCVGLGWPCATLILYIADRRAHIEGSCQSWVLCYLGFVVSSLLNVNGVHNFNYIVRFDGY
jgi:hypothetical protein